MPTVDSASDNRTANNAVRHQYRVLSEAEKQQMVDVKDMGLQFIERLHGIGGTRSGFEGQSTRDLSIAQTKIEEAVMWAVKHVTA